MLICFLPAGHDVSLKETRRFERLTGIIYSSVLQDNMREIAALLPASFKR